MARFTHKQKAFIDNYIKTLNGTEAARRAKYQGDDNTLGVIAYENLRKPKIRDEIDRRLRELAITDDEILFRLQEQATADMGDALEIDESYSGIDLAKLKAMGKTHLIKKYKVTKRGIELEFYDAQSALVHLLKLRRLHEGKPTVIVKLQQAIENGRITPDQVRERWPNLADKLFSEAGINVGD